MKTSASWRHLKIGMACLVFAMGSGVSKQSSAVELENRWGLGMTNLSGSTGAAIGVDWRMSRANSVEFIAGFDTDDTSQFSELGARLHRALYIEDQMVHSLYLGGGLASTGSGGSSKSGFIAETGLASKFFLSGLPNFGLGLGGGVRLNSAGDIKIRTQFFGSFFYYF